MPRKTLEELDEGMVTEEAVLDNLGNVVLREGVELTKTLILALKNRGVTSISAGSGGEEDPGQAGLSEQEKTRMRRQVDEKVDRMFTGHKDRLMRELAEAAKRHLKRKIK